MTTQRPEPGRYDDKDQNESSADATDPVQTREDVTASDGDLKHDEVPGEYDDKDQ